MKTILYYFTGTGNSLEIARMLAAMLPDTELRSFATAYRQGHLDTEAEAVGFVFPVYFLGVPVAFRHLLEKTQWKTPEYTFAIANFGSMPGDALHQTAALIANGGGRLDAGYLIQMPDNYLPVFEVPKKDAQNRSFYNSRQKIESIAAGILSKEKSGIEKSKYRIDRLLTGLMYPTVNKFKEMDRNYWVADGCNGCGICAQSCPFDNLGMSDHKPQWQHHCEMCMRCIHICPQKAIQYKNGTMKKGRYRHPEISVKDLLEDGSLRFSEKKE